MKVCVDTMIFIDVLKNEFPEGQKKFYSAIEKNDILMTSVVNVAELMPMFHGESKELFRFLDEHRVKISNIDLESALVSSERWLRYLNNREKRLCPSCGEEPIPGRDKILSDFFIGGFALAHCDRVLTRDRGVYNKYFKDLEQL